LTTVPSRNVLFWWAGAALAVFLVLAVLVAAHWVPLDTVDVRVDAAAHRAALADGWLRGIARIVTDAGSPVGVDVVTGIAAVAFLLARRVAGAVVLLVARFGELGTETLGKLAVDRARPVFAHPLAVAGGSSYPSGHAAGSAALYGTLVLLCVPLLARAVAAVLSWVVAAAAGVFVLAVAASRVLLGVHYVSDVVGGLALGLAWAAGTVAVGARMRHESPDRVVHGA
jgi:undecaprenyl-diphosphatase